MEHSKVINEVQHIILHADRAYLDVTQRIEAEVHRLDESFRELLAENKIDELRESLKQASEPHGLMIHHIATHGDWLALVGQRRPGVVYHIGHVLSAVQMTQYAFGAGLYAPLRLAVYENDRGGTTFEYDLPSTQFGIYHDSRIDIVAKSLDDRLLALIENVTDNLLSREVAAVEGIRICKLSA